MVIFLVIAKVSVVGKMLQDELVFITSPEHRRSVRPTIRAVDLVVRSAKLAESKRKHFSVSLVGPPTKPLTRAVSLRTESNLHSTFINLQKTLSAYTADPGRGIYHACISQQQNAYH
mgnify:CR=1 FL=1